VRWVVDASAAVEILLRTQAGDQAWAIVKDADAYAPDLLDAEVLAVLRRENLAGRLADARAAEALEDLRDWDLERVPSRSLTSDAWRYRHNVSAYDALYVAVARRLGGTLLTADGPLSRAPGLDVPVHVVRS
jgi:predicted nucleic acid-binding protein